LKEPVDEKIIDQLDTHYYTADIHRAAFALPAFVRKVNNDRKFSYSIEIISSFRSLLIINKDK
jgi:hypothetical protein